MRFTRRKVIPLKQIRSGAGATREVRAALKALGLGELYKFVKLPNTREVRDLIAKVGHFVSILDGPDILFPREKSTLGEERIRDVVEEVRAAMKKESHTIARAALDRTNSKPRRR
jgi:ribosomal protein L30/L7E